MDKKLYCTSTQKGHIDDVNNYRGISIVSCFGKLFTSDILTDAQFGFRPGLSTVNAIFVLQSLILKQNSM